MSQSEAEPTFDSNERLAKAVSELDASELSAAYERLIDSADNRLTAFSRGAFDSTPAATGASAVEVAPSSRVVE